MNYNKKEWFFIDNKSGNKTKELYLKKYYVEVYKDIEEYLVDMDWIKNKPFKEKLWYFIHDLKEQKKCTGCNKPLEGTGTSLTRLVKEFCSNKCFNNSDEFKKRTEKGGLDNNDIKYYMQSKDFKEKARNTFLKNFDKNREHALKRSLERKVKKFPEINFKENNLKYYTIECDNCKEDFQITKSLFKQRKRAKQTLCTKCNPIGIRSKSDYEEQIHRFLEKNGINVIIRNKKILNKKEIDIFLPEYKFGIEFNGDYWHTEEYKNKNYHLEKVKESFNKGIFLIQIWENEWIDYQEYYKSEIKNYLNISDYTFLEYNYIINKISKKETNDFLKSNYKILKFDNSYGLYVNGELMTITIFNKNEIKFFKKNNYTINNYEQKFIDYFNTNNIKFFYLNNLELFKLIKTDKKIFIEPQPIKTKLSNNKIIYNSGYLKQTNY